MQVLVKSFQYFGSVIPNSTVPNDFAEVRNMTNHMELWDAGFTR